MNLEVVRTIVRWMAIAAILYVLGALVPGLPLFGAPPVEMPGGPRTTSGVSPALEVVFLSVAPAERVHFVVQFRRDLAESEIADLSNRLNIELDGPVPEHAYITSASAADWLGVRDGLLGNIPPAVKILEFMPRDRISDRLRDPNDPDLPSIPPYSVVGPNNVAVYVRFFDDVSLARQTQILLDEGAEQPDAAVLTRGPTGIWAIHISITNLDLLILYDEVRFIEPTTPEIVEDMDHAAKDVGAPSVGMDGAGALIAQWESCHASTTHGDMASRVLPAGNISFLCRSWQFADLSDDGAYQMGEPIGVDLDEDGTIDTMLDGGAIQVPATAKWPELPTYISEAGRLYVDAIGDPTIIELGDITFSIFPNTATVTPDLVNTLPNDVDLFRYLFARHPTLVAGIIISNSQSHTTGGDPTYEGIVPAATIRSHVWMHSTVVFDYWNAMQAGARISSNSFGWEDDYHYLANVDPYWGISEFYDEVVSGRSPNGGSSGLPARMLVVASSGNEGENAAFWRTGRIVNSAKNVIAVGNVSSSHAVVGMPGFGAPASRSGRGPTVDGRLTPILSAPGTQMQCFVTALGWNCVRGQDGGITSTLPGDGDAYAPASGTSFSTPIVSGAAALLTESYKASCLADPAPQDLRAILVHSARDLYRAYNLPGLHVGNELPGPDFVFGYGLIQVDDAAEMPHNTVNEEIESGWVEHRIMIDSLSQLDDGAGGPQLRVTLVWDDPPYYSEYPPRESTGLLQNDLDLEVIDPDGNRHLPWVLDASQGHESDPATRVSRPPFAYVLQEWRDHRNTIEQVVVDFDTTMLNEQWTIRVRGHEMRRAPQNYTLVSRAFTDATATDCGDFSNGSTVKIASPIDIPDTQLAWVLFWLGVIILIWLVFEAVMWLFLTLWTTTGPVWAYAGAIFLLLLLYVIFRLLLTQSFLILAYLVLFGLAYVLWRALQP